MSHADPALCAENFVSEDAYSHKGHETGAIGPGNVIDELVVVDFGEDEHGQQSNGDVVSLLGMESGVLCVQRGGINLKHRNGAEKQDQAEESPVEIAKAEDAAHRGLLSLPRACGQGWRLLLRAGGDVR